MKIHVYMGSLFASFMYREIYIVLASFSLCPKHHCYRILSYSGAWSTNTPNFIDRTKQIRLIKSLVLTKLINQV